jgi:hypothetical protein
MPGYDQLVKELESFPNAKHDDFPDALAQAIAAPTGVWQQTVPTPRTALDDIHRWIFDKPTDEGGDSGNFGGSNGPCGMN